MQGNKWLAFVVFFPMAGALLSYLIGRKKEKAVNSAAIFVAAAELAVIGILAAGTGGETSLFLPGICGLGLHFTMDGFRVIYGGIAVFMWTMTILFSREYFAGSQNTNRYYLFNLWTLGATVGVFLSADLYTAFLFFEMMSFTSYVWVAQEETKKALRAAQTYLAVSVVGGLVLLMGLFLLYQGLGTLQIGELREAAAACEDSRLLWGAGVCILFGFGAKAGAFPLHIWLPKAHPVAPAPASALLSGILTKAGIFGILVISCQLFFHDRQWGTFLLWIGIFTMFGGALLAVCSVDLKRTLACSSMSQIGFILIGIGMQGILGEENALAVRGTFLHMVNHSLFKLVLFLAAGVVAKNLHKLDLNEIRGFGRNKPFLQAIFLMGAMGISGIPLWNGYISKTLLHESIAEAIHLEIPVSGLPAAEWIFLVSGGMTLAYMTKLYVAVFLEKNKDPLVQKKYDSMKKSYISRLSAFALAVPAVLFPIMGMFPHAVMDRVAKLGRGFFGLEEFGGGVAYFNLTNLKGAAISIVIGAAIYGFFIRRGLMRQKDGNRVYINGWPSWLDLENLIYRPLLLKVLPFLFGVFCRIFDSLVDGLLILLRKTVYRDRKIPHELEEGSTFTHLMGSFFDWIRRVKYKLRHEEIPEEAASYEHRFALMREQFIETNTIIRRSLSFGLLLFYVGLVFTLLYMLLV